jgi:acetyl esterase/lipase
LVAAVRLGAADGVPRSLAYRVTPEAELQLHVYATEAGSGKPARPAIVFFFGGGWRKSNPGMFSPFARPLAGRGMVAICADYRVGEVHGTSPFDALDDARAAIRWVRAHARELGIDPQRIAAGGGSSGGHLAAACALIEDFADAGDDLPISCRPDALVLFNPVVDNGPEGYGYERLKERWREFSPLEHVSAGGPPTLFMTGSEDQLIKVAAAEQFAAGLRAAGTRCDLIVYPDAKHGFFNWRADRPNRYFTATLEETDRFFVSLGWLPPSS